MTFDKTPQENQKARNERSDNLPDKSADASEMDGLTHLQNQLGNQAVQRLLAQRSGDDGAFDLDDDTAGRINSARGGGQALEGNIQTQMSEQMGQDFSGVRVHTSLEANDLNDQLNAKAFTTGQDIFFKEGAYDPHSSSGQELIAHELTHVVQQGSGAVGSSGSGMQVNPPGDAFEQEADAVAKAVVGAEGVSQTGEEAVQREELPEEEDPALLQGKFVQRQEELLEEEEDPALLQGKFIQREDEFDDDEM